MVVRGRVFDGAAPASATEDEEVGGAIRRTVRRFLTAELPGVRLTVTIGGTTVETTTDDDGYYRVAMPGADTALASPWTRGLVELAGSAPGTSSSPTEVQVRVPGSDAAFGIISDIDDTILETGVQRVSSMVRTTFTGTARTRNPFPGAAALYRDLAGAANPVFYVSSSPWNLHSFLVAFLRHRDFPIGPLLLRDLLGDRHGRAEKRERIDEVLALHPGLPFVLIGDSGERDPEVYADVVRRHPGRVLAVYIREVRLDPTDGRVERVSDAWEHDVPFVLAADSDDVRRHAAGLGLL